MASESTNLSPSPSQSSSLDEASTPTVPPPPGKVGDPAGPVLVGLLLLLAFATAWTPIRNSDFLQHLALGRDLFSGQLPLGTDPLTAPGEPVVWAHHSVLFDALLYLLFSLGGVILILLVKGLLTVLVVEQQRRVALVPGTQAAPAVLCLLLGLIVLSPFLLVQSRLASIVLLGTTVYFLSQYHTRAEKVPPIWTLPLICVFWGNLDNWFFLGPLVIGLYFGGLVLDEYFQPAPADGSPSPSVKAPISGIFFASLIASFLNPGLFALSWSLPPELGLNGCLAAVGDLPGYRALSASPLSSDYFQATSGWSLAGQGYFVLLLLAVASFPLLGRRLSRGGLFVVLGLGALSLCRVAAIPFFAVAAAPWLARNVQELLVQQAARAAADPLAKKPDATGGVLLTGLALVLVGIATFAGWLGPWPWTQSRLGFTLEVDPGLKSMAERTTELAEWYRDKTGTDVPTWFNTSPAAAHYIAWFAPGQRTYIDQRLALSPQAAADYRAILLAPFQRIARLMTSARPQGDPYDIVRDRGIRFIAFHQDDLMAALRLTGRLGLTADDEKALPRHVPVALALYELTAVSGELSGQAGEWPNLHLRGATSLFGFCDPSQPDQAGFFDAQTQRFPVRAFGPNAQTAPATGPTEEAEPRAWITTLWNPLPLRNADAEEAAQYGLVYEASKLALGLRNRGGFQRAIAGTICFGLSLPDLPIQGRAVLALLRDQVLRGYGQNYLPDQDQGGASVAYLTLGAARRSLLANPLDAHAHYRLARAYFSLAHETREGTRSQNFPHLQRLRHYQTIAAAQAAVRLDPDLEEAHQLLAQTYSEFGIVDLFLKHYREAVRCNVAAGPRPGEPVEKAQQRWKAADEHILVVQKEVETLTSQFTVQTAGSKALEKAAAASRFTSSDGRTYGLVEKALEILRNLPPEELLQNLQGQTPGASLLIEALLEHGDLTQVRASLHDDARRYFGLHPVFGLPAFDWYRVCLGASAGDYEDADAALAAMLQGIEQDRTAQQARDKALQFLSESLLAFSRAIQLPLQPRVILRLFAVQASLRGQQLALATREVPALASIVRTLRAGLFLERGDTSAARAAVDQALEKAQRADIGFLGQPMALLYRELLQSGEEPEKKP